MPCVRTLLLIILISRFGFTQDIHFSEFYASSLNLNPALTGMFLGDLRVGISYRDQYRAVADPYQTLSLAVDVRKTNVARRHHSLGYGAIVNADVAGDANFGTYQFGIPFAFHFYLSKKLRFSTGFITSFQTISLNEDKLRFGDQYDDLQYNQDNATTEPLGLKPQFGFNIAAGINIRYYIADRNLFGLGVSAYNINSPNLSFYGKSDVRQFQRLTISGMWRFAVAKYADAIPMFKFSTQGPNKEFQIGGQLYKYIRGSIVKSVNFGLWCRALDRDAIIANLGFNYNMFYLGMDYDVNVSKLSKASQNRGAFEIHGILYLDKTKMKKKQKIVSCPGHI